MPRPKRTHCADCGVTLTDENGYRRSEAPYGFRSTCKRCRVAHRRAAHDRAEARRRETHGMTGDVCEICGATETVTRGGRVRLPTVDHDHVTGKIRGVLCSRCNAGLGMFRDSSEWLRTAAAYLDRHAV